MARRTPGERDLVLRRRRLRSLSAHGLCLWGLCGVSAVACGDEGAEGRGSGDGDGDDTTTTWVAIDTDGDGIFDGIDTDGDGMADIVGAPIDTDGDGVVDSLDTNGDGIADVALPGFMLPGGVGGTGNSGTGGGPRGSVCEGPRIRGGAELLIDDLEHAGDSAIPEVDRRVGAWFVAADLVSGAAQTPQADAVYPTEGVGRDGSHGFASTLSGFSGRTSEDSGVAWGPQFGLTLNEDDGNLCAYDASAFDGVTFCAASGDGKTHTLDFAVPMLFTIPKSRGGTCSGEGCGDGHSMTITIGAEWRCDYDIEWAQLSQNRTLEHNNKYPFDPANIAQIIWTSWAGDHDVIVDDVRFLGGEVGMGGAPGGAPGGAGGAP